MKRSSVICKSLILGLFLAAGFAIVWGLGGLWLMQIIDQAAYSGRMVESLRFRQDGTPVVMSYPGNRYELRTYRDIAGNRLEISETDERWLNGVHLPAHTRRDSSYGPAEWPERIATFADRQLPPVYWYFVSGGRTGSTGYLVGFDSLSNGQVGYIGTGGFREGGLPKDELFPFSGLVRGQGGFAFRSRVLNLQFSPWGQYPSNYFSREASQGIPAWYVYIHTDDNRIHQVDLSKRTAQVASSDPSLRSAGLWAEPGKTADAFKYRLFLRTDDQIQSLDENNQVRQRFRIPAELREQDFNWSTTTRGDTLVDWSDPFDSFSTSMNYNFRRVDANGNVHERGEVAIGYHNTLPRYRWLIALIAPCPAAMEAIAFAVIPAEFLNSRRAASYPQAVALAVGQFSWSLVTAHLIAVILAWLCYRRQQQYGATRLELIVWTIFVLIVGLPGWIGYRYSRSWPALERCSSCGRLVPQDRTRCVLCQTETPTPALKGIEVFA